MKSYCLSLLSHSVCSHNFRDQDFWSLCHTTGERHLSGLTPQFLLSQQRGVLQQAQKARQAVGHDATQRAVLPQSQQTSVSVPQQSLRPLGNVQGHSAQLLEQLTVSGLQRMLWREAVATLKTAHLKLKVRSLRYWLSLIHYMHLSTLSILQQFVGTCCLNSTRRCCNVLILSNSLFRIRELRYWIRACENNNTVFQSVALYCIKSSDTFSLLAIPPLHLDFPNSPLLSASASD